MFVTHMAGFHADLTIPARLVQKGKRATVDCPGAEAAHQEMTNKEREKNRAAESEEQMGS